MSLATLASKVLDSKNIIAAMLVAGGLIASLYGMSNVPAQAAASQKAIEDHSKTSYDQIDATNRKLGVLICLQAKLDTPIRCVAKETKQN